MRSKDAQCKTGEWPELVTELAGRDRMVQSVFISVTLFYYHLHVNSFKFRLWNRIFTLPNSVASFVGKSRDLLNIKINVIN